ncbi:MAG: glycoside hydrolase family 92 protein, partial [Bacteroidales bacterium]|nr:glycoside hydrolase family 92 protein [Bacteroidales bacterium]
MKLNGLCFWALALLSGALFVSCSSKPERFELQSENLTQYVNPMVGTDVHGHTFPGAVMPFGMVQLSPDTRLDGWDGCSAYHFEDSVVYGFSHTHLSGTGCSDYGDVLLMPMCGKYSTNNAEYSSKFSHQTEVAEPGYYAVKLEESNIDVELTVSPRVGIHRYKFNNQGKRYIVLDLEHRDIVLEAGIRKAGDNRYTGVRRSQAWAADQHLFFAMDFSADVSLVEPQYSFEDTALFNPGKAIYVFEVQNDSIEEVLVKVAISQVDEQGAVKNLDAEIPDWDFDKVRQNASEAWNKELNKIIVKGGSDEQKKVFYTAMYHACIQPCLAQDVDGRYRGTDLKIHSVNDFTYYTVFSLWDTYRAAHPLYTITQQNRTVDFIKTFLAQYSQGGRLPMWELSSNYTKCMIGYHAIPPMVDAYVKNIRCKDLESLELEAMNSAATANELGKRYFMKYGFMSVNDEHESVSKNLEYGFDDWCIAQFAHLQGDEEMYREYMIRSQAYKHIFNAECGLMCPRQNGAWKDKFDPKEVDFNFTEANSWQYSFYVPHDIFGFIDLMGGNDKFEAKLDALFTETSETFGKDQKDISGMIGQYAHGNEPSHHIAYLYNYCGKPAKTQKLVRQIMDEMYNSTPAGNCGNEDCGQMSAWYVLSAMGFYPVNPANAVFDLGSPIFDTIQITLDNGKKCLIVTHNNSSENMYVESMELNGKPYSKSYINYSDIADGGRFDFYMTSNADNGFGQQPE